MAFRGYFGPEEVLGWEQADPAALVPSFFHIEHYHTEPDKLVRKEERCTFPSLRFLITRVFVRRRRCRCRRGSTLSLDKTMWGRRHYFRLCTWKASVPHTRASKLNLVRRHRSCPG